MEIIKDKITIYQNIQVGDIISSVLSKYKYENKTDNFYYIVFNSDNEIDITSSNEETDYYIYFFYEDDTVTKTQMYDSYFAENSK